MRIAVVSPYSWTYPGGVTRHIEALAAQQLAAGHEVRVLSPVDPDDSLSARLHRGVRPARRDLPQWLVPLGRTFAIGSNGAMSNLALTPHSASALRREIRRGYDIVHVHEPVAPVPGWDALCCVDAPLVGTFHCYSENSFSNQTANLLGARRRLNRLHVRIAVSEAAAWTGKRYFGGTYRIIPNGVDVPGAPPGSTTVTSLAGPLRIAFIGQAVERKGLSVLLRSFEALRDLLPVTLDVVGVAPDEVARLMIDARGVTALGKCSDSDKRRVLERADILCAPSLGGESFGMVLTEAFAAGTPVVASDIAGYRDVVDHGVNGFLVPRGDATALAERLRDMAVEPRSRMALEAGAIESAARYAWPRVAADVMDAYGAAIDLYASAPTGIAAP